MFFEFLLGHYCEFSISAPVKCKAGTYMPYGVNQTSGALIGPGTIFVLYNSSVDKLMILEW